MKIFLSLSEGSVVGARRIWCVSGIFRTYTGFIVLVAKVG